ncbi:tyrosine-type recombinase/integrase [Paramuribaculum intestinale]|uniref:tyrosine-type recombinase/integrase n=2 Tax=Paramuribaculum intestinale TaxID=2094151 RepID=UPI0025A99DF5|nr:tyrosine-type recombinase/integrase [Paramuribaculum intestinale]
MSKKMLPSDTLKQLPLSYSLGYTYPRLHTGKSWYVDFYAIDPATNMFRRKKYCLNRIPSKKLRREQATEMITTLLNLLRSGWNPWQLFIVDDSSTLLKNAFDLYKEHIKRQLKERSITTNLSFLHLFSDYLSRQRPAPTDVRHLTTALITKYLDHLYLKKHVSARTRNNYRGFLSTLCEFFVSRKMLESNPVDPIKLLKETEKKRQPLTKSMLKRLNDYLSEHDRWMLLACRLEYYTFIRPGELRQLKINDINIMEMKIHVNGQIAKNGRSMNVAINREIITLMIDLGLFNYPGNMYIFGSDLRPSLTPADKNLFPREWGKIRDKFCWAKCYQFYSLKDSGIRDLANSVGIVVARDQARHSDISTTNRYLQGRDTPVHDAAINFKGVL